MYPDKYNLSKTDLTNGTHVLENSNFWNYYYLRQIDIAIQTEYGIKVIYSTKDIKK